MEITEVLITAFASFFALSVSIYNIVKKFNFTLNKIYSLLTFLVSILYALFFIQLLNIELIPLVISGKIYYAIVTLIAQAFFHVMQIYPDGKIKKRLVQIIFFAPPGLILSFIILFSNFIIADVTFEKSLNIHHGEYFVLYNLVVISYLLGGLLILVAKSILIKNRVLRKEMQWLLLGLGILIISVIIFAIIFPIFFDFHYLSNISHPIAVSYILFLMNFAVTDIDKLDIKKTYNRTLYFFIVFLLLFIPVFILLQYLTLIALDINLIIIAASLLFIIYFITVFSKIVPKIDYLFQKEYLNMVNNFNEYFGNIDVVNFHNEEGFFWDKFYQSTIDVIVDKFQISGGYFFLYNQRDNHFKLEHSVGNDINLDSLDLDNNIIKGISPDCSVVDCGVLDFDIKYEKYKDHILGFFNEKDIEIMLPIFNYDKQLIGIIFFGFLPKNRIYPKMFLNVLELFRIQFQHQLINSLTLEEVKVKQIIKHDQMVANNIKKKIVPSSLNQIKGIRVSSFHMSNSIFGGDFFDSVVFNDDKLIIFIADTSYSDIESGILSMELYTVIHSLTKNHDSPDKIMNNMNWVITTSRFSKQYSSAFCMTFSSNGEIEYSNAAFNPMFIYSPKNKNFIKCDIKGIPVGVDQNFDFDKKTIKVESGNIGILYSAGFSSAINDVGEMFSLDMIKNLIANNSHDSAEVLTRKIYHELDKFIGKKRQVNDITLILFKTE